ncbi:MAG: methyltransferase [Candidatus Diapherotrites archaeon]|nr:methyltransferase [Candidatus Diapherotrites archaeon]
MACGKLLFGKKTAEDAREIYEPHEDSFLLEGAILRENLAGKKCLDLGCGSGIQSKAMFRAGAHEVLAVDINKVALKETKRNTHFLGQRPKTLRSNLFSKVRKKFDFIAFNPPYVPSEAIMWKDVDGGERGRKIIDRFLAQVEKHINPKGVLLLVVSSLNDEREIVEILRKMKFEVSFAAGQKIFFETIFVLRAVKK